MLLSRIPFCRSPERIRPIAERFGLDGDAVLVRWDGCCAVHLWHRFLMRKSGTSPQGLSVVALPPGRTTLWWHAPTPTSSSLVGSWHVPQLLVAQPSARAEGACLIFVVGSSGRQAARPWQTLPA